MPTVAAIYVRVSDRLQESNYSLPTQERACREYAAARGLIVDEAHVYREVHTATELAERPALTRAREAMARGAFGALVCYDPDRFSRNQIHTAILQYYCERAGVALHFAAFEFERSATGQFLLQARAFAAELEHEKIRERTTRGKLARVAAGKLPGSARPPYGYRYADAARTRLEEDPATAPIARRIFARAVAGATLRQIAAELTAEGIPTPTGGAAWYFTTIGQILNHPAYGGHAAAFTTYHRREGGRWVHGRAPDERHVPLPAGTIPALVDAGTLERVAARLARNKAEATRRQAHPERFLLRGGYAVCGYCGGPVLASWKGRDGEAYPVYRAGANRHAACAPGVTTFSLPAEELDRAVWRIVLAHMLEPARLLPGIEARDAADADPYSALLAAAEGALAATARRVANLARAIGAMDDDGARAALEAELRAAAAAERAQRAERDRLAGDLAAWRARGDRRRDLLARWVDAGRAALRAGYAERREALADLGVRVLLYEGREFAIEADAFAHERAPLTVSGRSTATVHNGAPVLVLRARARLE